MHVPVLELVLELAARGLDLPVLRSSGDSLPNPQEGYSVFSVRKSQEEGVKKYIKGQAAHYKKEDFRSELLRMLRAHALEFDERYVFD